MLQTCSVRTDNVRKINEEVWTRRGAEAIYRTLKRDEQT